MATAALIPVDQYLRSTYRPDCDYVDGELHERNPGERWHSAVQTMIAIIFGRHRQEWGLMPITEQRVQVSADRYRVPDICVVRTTEPFTPILHRPPVLCIEVLSTEDRFSRILERVEEYIAMGVPQVWMIDPRTREVWTVGLDARPVPFRDEVLSVEGTPALVRVAELFALIDETPGGTASTHDA